MTNTLVVADVGDVLQFTCFDNTGAIIDLTEATHVYLNWSIAGATAVQKSCSVSSPATAGIATYTIQSGDLDAPGTMTGEIEIEFPDGVIITSQDVFKIPIRPRIGGP